MISISFLSKEYERFYNELIKNNSLLETTSILNDLLILAIRKIKDKNKRKFNIRLSGENDYYFSSIELVNKNINSIEKIYKSILDLVSLDKSLDSFEKMLGQVLEKGCKW